MMIMRSREDVRSRTSVIELAQKMLFLDMQKTAFGRWQIANDMGPEHIPEKFILAAEQVLHQGADQ